MKNKILLLIFSITIFSCSNVDTISQITYEKDLAVKGAVLFKKNCMECHGNDATGRYGAANLVKIVTKYKDFSLKLSLSQMSKKMPGWKYKNRLSESELRQISNYLKELASTK